MSFPLLRLGDGTLVEDVDLLFGADGLRSVARQFAFPDHKLHYSGNVAYRALIPQSKVAHIEGIPDAAVFWHTLTTWAYTCPLDNGIFEINVRVLEPEEHGNKVSWSQEATKDQVVKHFTKFHPIVRGIINAPDSWQEYALYGGPRLESVIAKDRIALIGDASHPLSGAFRSGAAFALEDAYTLKEALNYAHRRSKPLSYVLELYDTTRSPHYKSLDLDAQDPPLPADEIIAKMVEKNWDEGPTAWIFKYDIANVWIERVAEEDAKARRTDAEYLDLCGLPPIAVQSVIAA